MNKQPKFIEKIHIRGLKSIRDASVDLNSLNILIGSNGSGKSNFLSAFHFLNYANTGDPADYGRASDVFHFGTNRTKEILIKIQTHNHDSAHVVKFKAEKATDEIKLDGLPDYLTSDSKYRNVEYTVYSFQNTSPHSRMRSHCSTLDNVTLHPDGSNIAAIMNTIKHVYNEIEDYYYPYDLIKSHIQTICPYFKDFVFNEDKDGYVFLDWKHKDFDKKIFRPYQLSDGTLRFILLATLLMQPNLPKVIIIDNPELGLHPDALQLLAEIIQDVSKETQIIITTQSAEFANLFNPEDFIVVDYENGESKFKRLDKDKLKPWLEKYNVGDIWRQNRIGGRP